MYETIYRPEGMHYFGRNGTGFDNYSRTKSYTRKFILVRVDDSLTRDKTGAYWFILERRGSTQTKKGFTKRPEYREAWPKKTIYRGWAQRSSFRAFEIISRHETLSEALESHRIQPEILVASL